MLTNVLISLGLVVAILALVDLLLGDRQKKSIANWIVRCWMWLDDKKKFFQKPWRRTISQATRTVLRADRWLLTGLVVGIWNIFNATHLSNSGVFLVFVGTFLSVIVVVPLVRPSFARFLLRRESVPAILLSYVIAVVLAILYMKAIVAFSAVVDSYIKQNTFRCCSLETFTADIILATALAIALLILILSLAVVPLGFVYVVMGLLWSAELIVRRLAEYPKGPVLAAGIFVAAVVAIFKIFNSGP